MSETKPTKPQTGNNIRIEANEDLKRGRYSNLALVSHTAEEFLIDFVLLGAGAAQGQGTLNARVILSPAHAKRMVKALQDNLVRHEAQFGPIPEPPRPATPPTPTAH